MKVFRSILIACSLAAGTIAVSAPAFAVPPTVEVNPGYDRRLSESRHGPHYFSAPVRPYHPHRHHSHWHR
jgi:murein endopeptidase